MKELKIFACWLWKSGKDFAPAYKSFFSKKRRDKISPLKKGALERAGGHAHRKSLERVIAVSMILPLGYIACVVAAGALLTVLTKSFAFILVIVFLVAALFALIPVLIYQNDNYLLGYLGERAVGDELDKLGRQQWRVFHNFDTGKGNIDHVIVCPKGVFCVETKTLRKRTGVSGQQKLVFKNGAIFLNERKLDAPDPIRQSRRNAAELHKYLVDKCGGQKDKIPFIPSIIAFPGWYVEISAGHYDKDIIPCNPKGIGGVFAKREDALDGKMFEKICAAIEDKNRIDLTDTP